MQEIIWHIQANISDREGEKLLNDIVKVTVDRVNKPGIVSSIIECSNKEVKE
jgi:hypothetical protein